MPVVGVGGGQFSTAASFWDGNFQIFIKMLNMNILKPIISTSEDPL